MTKALSGRTLAYSTKRGKMYAGDALATLRRIRPASVQLVLTSPPFALGRKKAYGNAPSEEYVEWLQPFVSEIRRVLKPDGSFVIDLGGSWSPGSPEKNVYQYEVLIALVRGRPRWHLAQEFFWLNRARLPSPVEWVNVRRIRVTDAVNVVWWLARTPHPYADNRAVLRAYSASMQRLFESGYNSGLRPSEWNIGAKSFSTRNGGSIPSNFVESDDGPSPSFGYPTNLLAGSNTASRDPYLETCRRLGISSHPARFPTQFADFFVRFLTREEDLVVDPFAGSNTTGYSAETLKRKWIACDLDPEYAAASAARFGMDPEAVIRKLGQETFSRIRKAGTGTVQASRRKRTATGQLTLTRE